MAGKSRMEKEAALVVSVIKEAGKYDVPKIIEELGQLETALGSLAKNISQSFKLKLEGAKDIVALKNSLVSMNRTLVPVTSNLNSFFKAVNEGTSNLNPIEIIKLEAAIVDLIEEMKKLNVSQLSKDFASFVTSVLETAKSIQTAIKPLNEFENAIGKLDTKIQASLQSLQKYSEFFKTLQVASGGVASNIGGTRVPVFKSKEADVTNLVGQYTKLSDQIDRASVSIQKYNAVAGKDVDAGTKKQVAADIKRTQAGYEALIGTVARLNVELSILEHNQQGGSAAATELRKALSSANAQASDHAKHLQAAEQAAVTLANAERKLRDEYQAQFNDLGAVIKRQAEFVISAGILAGSASFVRKGFESAFVQMNEVQRILSVSRSDFLTTADTVKLLGDTLYDFSARTGESVGNVATVLKELGSAGLTTEQSIAALKSTLNNIIATDSSVVETTRLVASTYNILGDSLTGTSDKIANFTKINDVLGRATLESSLEMDQLVQSLKFALPAAKESGLELEDLTGILAQLADQGIKGGNAGRALRAALQQISKDAPGFAKAFNIDIPLDKPLKFLDIVEQFGKKIKGQEINVEELGVIFSKLGLRGADIFLLLGQNADKVRGKIDDLRKHSDGFIESIAGGRLEAPSRQFAILGENLAQLSATAFEPLIKGLIFVVKLLNDFAETVKLISNNSLVVFVAKALALIASLKIIIVVLTYVGTLLPTIEAAFATLSTAMAFVTFQGVAFGAGIAALLPVLALIAVAIGLVAIVIQTKFFKSSEILRKELNDQRSEIDKTIKENEKLVESYEKISDRLLKNSDDLEKGNITLKEYKNDLNNMAIANDEVNGILRQFGTNARGAADALDKLNKARKEQIDADLNKSQNLGAKSVFLFTQQISDSIEKYKESKLRIDQLGVGIKNTEDRIKRFNDTGKDSKGLATVLNIQNKELAEFKKNIDDLNHEILGKFAEALSQASKLSPVVATAVRLLVEGLQLVYNANLGKGSQIEALPGLLEKITEMADRFDIENVIFQVKEFANLATLEAQKGAKGLQAQFLFEFGIKIPDEEIAAFKAQMATISQDVAKDQIGKAFINEDNFRGISDRVAEQLKQGASRFNFDPSGLLGGIEDIASRFKDVEDVNERNNKQIHALIRLLTAISDIEINSIKNVEEKNKALERQAKLLEQYKALLVGEESVVVGNPEVVAIRNKAAELQKKEDKEHKLMLSAFNRGLRENRSIQRNIITQDEKNLELAKQRLEKLNNELHIVDRIKNTKQTDEVAYKKLLADEKQIFDATKAVAQLTEKEIVDKKKIYRSLEQSKTALFISTKYGKTTLDQSKAELLLLNQKKELNKALFGDGTNGTITQMEYQQAINEMLMQELEIRNKNIEAALSELNETISLRNKLQQIIFKGVNVEALRNQFNNEEAEITEKLLQNSKKLQEIDKAAPGFADRVRLLVQERGQLTLQQVELEKKRYEQLRKNYDQELKILDLKKLTLDQSSKLTQDAVKELEEPLKKLFGKQLAEAPFTEALKFTKALKYSLLSVDTLSFFNDTDAGLDEFFKQLRAGNVDISVFDEKTQAALTTYQNLNNELKKGYKEQNEITGKRFDIYQKLFDQAIKLGDFKAASDAFQNLANSTEVLDTETGKVDFAKKAEQVEKLRLAYEKLSKEDFSQNPMSKIAEVVEKVDTAIQSLNISIQNLKDLLSEKLKLGIQDGGKEAEKAIQDSNKLYEEMPTKLRDFSFELNATTLQAFTLSDAFSGLTKSIEAVNVVYHKQNPNQYAVGGVVPGAGSGDIVPAMLEPGEFVIPKKVVEDKGLAFFNELIDGRPARGYALGGMVRGYADGGAVDHPYVSLSYGGDGGDSKSIIEQLRTNNSIAIDSETHLSNIRESTLNLVNDGLKYVHPALRAIQASVTNLSSLPSDMSGVKSNTENLETLLETIARGVNKEFNQSKETGELVTMLTNNQSVKPGEMDAAPSMIAITAPPGMAFGGQVPGSGSGDIFPAMLEPGEFVIPKAVVEKYGLEYFMKLIGGDVPGFAGGGAAKPGNRGRAGGDTGSGSQFLLPAKTNSQIAEDKRLEDAKNIQSEYEKIKNTVDEINKAIVRQGATFRNVYNAVKFQLQKVVASSDNSFKVMSAKATLRLLDTIENIGSAFEELFEKTIPGFIEFFLNDIVLSNAKILAEYYKQRKEIAKTYKDQRADLIESLKRNEISYFDFFDKLEDLNKDKVDKDLAAEEEKNKRLEEQFQESATKIGEIIADLVKSMSTQFSDFAGSIGTILAPALGGLGSFIGGIGGSIGGEIGGVIGSGIGDFIGGVIGAIGGAINVAVQGLASLIPIIAHIATSTKEEFEGIIATIGDLPGEINRIINGKGPISGGGAGAATAGGGGLKDRIPELVDTITESLPAIGKAFADAIQTIFPLIAKAFMEIIPAAMMAVVPIIISIFNTIPNFLLATLLSVVNYIPMIFEVFKQGAITLFTEFQRKVPELLDQLKTFFGPDFIATVSGAVEGLIDSLITILSDPNGFTPVMAGLINAFLQKIPEYSAAIGGAIEYAFSNIEPSKLADLFVTIFDSVKKILFDYINIDELFPFLSIFDELFLIFINNKHSLLEAIAGFRIFINSIIVLINTFGESIFGLSGAINDSQPAMAKLANTIKKVNKVAGDLSPLVEAIFKKFGSIFQRTGDLINKITDKIVSNEAFMSLFVNTLSALLDVLSDPKMIDVLTALVIIGLIPLIATLLLLLAILTIISLALDVLTAAFDFFLPVINILAIILNDPVFINFVGIIALVAAGISGLIIFFGILPYLFIALVTAAVALSVALYAVLFVLFVLPIALAVLATALTALIAIFVIIAAAFTLSILLLIGPFLLVAIPILVLIALIAYLVTNWESLNNQLDASISKSSETVGAITLLIDSLNLMKDAITTLKDIIDAAKDNAVDSFKAFIDALIAAIPAPPGTSNNDGEDHNGNLPGNGFSIGGIIHGERGRDRVPAMLSDGEFVMTTKAVQKYGVNNLKKMNIGSLSPSTFSSSSSSQYFPPGSTSGLDNANSRDYYLANYYKPDGGSDATGSSAGDSQVFGPDSGTTANRPRSGASSGLAGGTSGDAMAAETLATKEGNIEKIDITIDLSGSNFSGDDVAERVERTLVEKLSDNRGPLASALRGINRKKLEK